MQDSFSDRVYMHFLHRIFEPVAYMQKLDRCLHLYLSVCFTLFTTNFTCPQFHEANPAFSKGFEFAKVRKVVDEEGKGAWRGEASDPVNLWTCLMAERVRGPDVHILSHST